MRPRFVVLALAVVVVVTACTSSAPPSRRAQNGATPSADDAGIVDGSVVEAPAAAKPGDPYQLDGIVARIRRTVAPQVGKGRHVGAIVGVRFRGETRILPFGETKAGNGTPPDARTMFEIGSITKTFTGLLLANAIERGRVKDSDRLDSFRPEWKGQATSDIRLVDLVTHRSGLAKIPCNLHISDPRRPYADYGDDDLVKGLLDRSFGKSCALGAHPSDEIAYSNWGFAVLGWVLAQSEKTTYGELVRERITKPLGLDDTTYDLSEDQQRRLAQGYTKEGDPTPLWDRKAMMGNGALRSTVTDLLAYGEAWLHPEKHGALEPAMRRAMTLQHQNAHGRIAYAWMQTPTGSLWHDGGTGGFTSLIKVYRSRDLVVVVLTNGADPIDCVVAATEDAKC